MAMNAERARKLEDRIVQIVAEMLERRVKDPRLGFVTVTEARLTGDLQEATVYYTVYGTPEEQADTAVALASATGLIRTEVGRQTGLRRTPSLTFVRDTLPEGAQHMEDLVARARAADAKLAAAREGAQPAGDPDPYRPPTGATAGDGDEEPGAGPGSPDGDEEPGTGPGSSGGERDPGTGLGASDGPGRPGGAAPDLGR